MRGQRNECRNRHSRPALLSRAGGGPWPMKSIVDIEINASRNDVAALLADPANMPQWMDDLARIEPISGELGMPGSKFRMVGRPGTAQTDFVVTVTARHLPE